MQGLITKDRKDIDPAALPFAKAHHEIEGLGLQEGAGLAEVVMLIESVGYKTKLLLVEGFPCFVKIC